MNKLSSYVFSSVFSAIALVLILLLGLEVVFGFIGELDELNAKYTMGEAFFYVLLTIPLRTYDLLPIAALVGGMTGLGMLASSSELTVMRASGVSIGRIVWWVIKPALVFIFAGLMLSQFVVPHTEEMAMQKKFDMQAYRNLIGSVKGYWHRENGDFMRIDHVDAQGDFQKATLFHFSDNARLEKVSKIADGRYQTNQQWYLEGLLSTSISEQGAVNKEQQEGMSWHANLMPEFLLLVTQNVESLSLTDLYRYAHFMKAQGLDAGAYFLQFWKKALAPLATLSMVLIACSFIFGPLRSVTMGLRIVAGVLAGLAFRYGQDFLGYASLVFDFSPVMAAGLPVLFCLLIGGVAIARVK